MNQELLNQFLGKLETSNSFQMMVPAEQAAIKSRYLDATDEQLLQAIQALDEDKITTDRIEAEKKKSEQELEESVGEIKSTLKSITKNERVEAEKVEQVTEKVQEEELLHEIEEMDKPKEEAPKKRKKFLGIF